MGKECGGVFLISSKYFFIFLGRYKKRFGKEEKGECFIF